MNVLELVAIVISVVSLGVAIYSWVAMRDLAKLKKSFFAGKNGADLEEILQSLLHQQQSLAAEQATTAGQLAQLADNFHFAVQKVGMVRFNPFDDGGGNFSFSVALLDALDSGVVITSMYGRQQNRIYAKKIVEGKGESALTEEEQEAISIAHQHKM